MKPIAVEPRRDEGLSLRADRLPVRRVAVAATRDRAVRDAYFAAVEDALLSIAGDQADEALGSHFRREVDRDPDRFRQRYFTPDTLDRCTPVGERFQCEIEGSLKVASLRKAVRRANKRTEAAVSQRLTFALSAARSRDRRARFVIDDLRGAIERNGHRVLLRSAANRAVSRGSVDYALGVSEVRFSEFDFDPAELRLEGALTVRFRLSDLEKREEVDTEPVTVRRTVAAMSPAAAEPVLVAKLSESVAGRIARQVNDSIVTRQREQAETRAALARVESGATLYLMRLEGLSQKDRAELRRVRELLRDLYPDARPQVVAGESDASEVTVSFSTTREVAPDDLLDHLYESIGPLRPGFGARYVGANEFVVSY